VQYKVGEIIFFLEFLGHMYTGMDVYFVKTSQKDEAKIIADLAS
jgi:hypothetical protein